MANFESTGFLRFLARDNGSALTAAESDTVFGANVIDTQVIENTGDNDIDAGDYWLDSGTPYSGYTITIRGNEYAVFKSASAPSNGTVIEVYVPYDLAFDDLADLVGTLVTQPITQTGDNAVVVNCFLSGTQITTPTGAVAIEGLQPGDLITTADGRAVPVRWVARQTLRRGAVNRVGTRDRSVVRISAGALGDSLPRRDLFVSADHAMALDGCLINAGAMVNHSSIAFVPEVDLPAEITYWHLETEAHEVILAEGAATESFIDYTGRAAFDNFAEYLAANGAERIIPEMGLPRIASSRLLPSLPKSGQRCA